MRRRTILGAATAAALAAGSLAVPGVFGSSCGSTGLEVAIVTPLRTTRTVTGPSLSSKPDDDTKSRCGNEMTLCGSVGTGDAAPAGTAVAAAMTPIAAALVIAARARLRARAPSLVLITG